ncbi:MAG: inositol monophosphatase [Acidimicrobiia bacterium]|nr:inositol monophosphatase [Acidimicrobiia bacterium]
MSDYLETALELAASAGQIMLEYFDIGVPADWKDDDTPVTVADEAINQMVVERVAAQYPEHGVIGEEASLVKSESRFQWVCDPIDGTLPYTLGIPTNVFSLALCDDGQPVVAVVEDPYLRRTYSATLGGGAFVNDDELVVSDRAGLRGSIMNVSGRSRGNAAWGAAIYYDLERAGVQQLHHNSMVYEVIQVASGMFDGAIFTKTTPWDAAAGALLVKEAGGKATDLYGREQRYDRAIRGAIFSNGLLHEELQALVSPHIIE